MADPSKDAVLSALGTAGITDFDFDCVITRGDTLYTRPTSRTYYGLKVDGDSVTVSRHKPNFQKRMQELHFGHGPSIYREFRKVFAVGMVFIILSGLWLGLSSSRLRRNTMISALSGAIVFFALIMSWIVGEVPLRGRLFRRRSRTQLPIRVLVLQKHTRIAGGCFRKR
jgi:hypothetical protein